MHKYLLKEYTTFEYDKEEAKAMEPGKPMVLKGILQRCDTLNQNGRVYPRDILLRELENYMKLVREDRAFGELDHANDPIVNLKNACHMVKKVWMEGNVVYGTVEILDTPAGNIIKAIIKAGGRPGISSRALGNLREEGNVLMVQDDLQIICWDFVSEPSTPGAYMMMSEAKKLDPHSLQATLTKSDRVDRVLNDLLAARAVK